VDPAAPATTSGNELRVFGGATYYYGGGVFYRRIADQGRTTFVVSAAPVGVVVDGLPLGCTTTVVADVNYYE